MQKRIDEIESMLHEMNSSDSAPDSVRDATIEFEDTTLTDVVLAP